MIQKKKKTQVILENATHEGDTGSPERAARARFAIASAAVC